jgi:quercetin dioxygenase-like cupin family protein
MGDSLRWQGIPYPDFFKTLPEIEVPVKGVRGWLIQGKERQVVFFELPEGLTVPDHSHGAQWGMVIDGEMRLTAGNETRILKKGDSYVIPAGVVHSAVFLTKVYAVDVFADPDRYALKKDVC